MKVVTFDPVAEIMPKFTLKMRVVRIRELWFRLWLGGLLIWLACRVMRMHFSCEVVNQSSEQLPTLPTSTEKPQFVKGNNLVN